MKKFLPVAFLLTAFAFFSIPLLAQPCIPDTSITVPGIYYNPMPDGCEGQPYSEVVNFAFPPDTTVTIPFPPFFLTIPFDSFVVSSVNNIPAGLNYQCNI